MIARLRAYKKARTTSILAVIAMTLMSLMITAPAANAGTDDYPSQWRSPVAMDSVVDSWGLYNRECVSFVAWRLSSRNGFTIPWAYGNAYQWGGKASSAGYAVNMTPAVGSVAWWGSNAGMGSYGHVAWVEAVNSNGTVTVEEYNIPGGSGAYSERTISASSVSGYIHFKDLATPPPPGSDSDGDGVSDASDIMPYVKGATNNRGAPIQSSRLSGDYNGDGKQDLMEMYDYGNAQTKFLVHYGDGAGGFAWPQIAWDSGPGNWDWKSLKPVVGDFNKDGKSDIAVFYDYGNNRVVLWELLGTSSGLAVGGIKWDSGPGMWTWSRVLLP